MNLDTMTFEELDALWREISEHPRKAALRLFPSAHELEQHRPRHYLNTTTLLGVYANDRIRAMQYRAGGHIAEAVKIEEQLKQLYARLPSYAKWR